MTSLRTLTRESERFLEYKRALGHPYRRGAFTLRSFLRHASAQVGGRDRVDLEGALRSWLAKSTGRKPVSVTVDLGALRQFFLYRRRSDPRAFVPDRTWAPQSTASDFLPHVLSADDVVRLIRLTATVRHPIRAATLRTFLIVLYCTGLRPGEAARLDRADLDLDARCFRIRESKGKSRFVPFGDDLADVLRAYLRERNTVTGSKADGPLFVRPDGSAMPVGRTSVIVARLLRRCGLKPRCGRTGPRLYDMRHTFAVHRLTAWYHAGADIHARLSWLSAYMGHNDLLGTEAYLTATPELLALAAGRFERRYQGEDIS